MFRPLPGTCLSWRLFQLPRRPLNSGTAGREDHEAGRRELPLAFALNSLLSLAQGVPANCRAPGASDRRVPRCRLRPKDGCADRLVPPERVREAPGTPPSCHTCAAGRPPPRLRRCRTGRELRSLRRAESPRQTGSPSCRGVFCFERNASLPGGAYSLKPDRRESRGEWAA